MPERSSFVVVANRLPVDEVTGPDGERQWRPSPGGLVTALHPVLTQHRGTWIGWSGGDGPAPDPFELEGIHIHPVPLSAEELERYYEGQSNATIWPLYHDAVETPAYRRRWRDAYRVVNQRFARAAAEVADEGATVWVQDYQLQLVPALLRELRPDLRIGFFLHIPFPPIELFMQMPSRAEILRGLLGADLVGFQQRLAGATPTGQGGVAFRDRTIRLGAFPISIDYGALDELSRTPEVIARAAEIRHELGDPRRLLLGVDRLDYTKGINVRLRAFEELLGEDEVTADETVFLQIATPSRERVEHYIRLRAEIEQTVGRINGDHGRIGHQPLHYLHQSLPREELTAFYLAADVMLVTPLRDGMNLVAKEYIACRHDDAGVLVLSEFTGAARELTSALLVNPHDTDGVKAAVVRALEMRPDEARRRMRTLRRHVRRHDVDKWARDFLDELGLPS